jgi:hypothetical protein
VHEIEVINAAFPGAERGPNNGTAACFFPQLETMLKNLVQAGV